MDSNKKYLDFFRERYPDKFKPANQIFQKVHRGDRIFVGSACAEPQYLIKSLTEYVESHPNVIFDAEVLHIWSLGVAPYADKKFKSNFRYNTFFVGNSTRDAVNEGMADYTPIFLSQVPKLLKSKVNPIDVALIQTSLPDAHGYMSLGVSVDIVKTATEVAKLIIVQANAQMPRVLGDGFIHIDNVDFVIPYDEPIHTVERPEESQVTKKIGGYVSRLVSDGDTIQVGYGGIPNAVIANLSDKKHLGIHTELLNDGLVDLIKKGVVDNSRKTVDTGRVVASFCMGTPETYQFLHDNPGFKFKAVDYTNDPLIIAQQDNMVAINSALEIDLTGQSTAVSIGSSHYSGIGGHADFMRGSVLAKNGKSILALPSTAQNDEISRIVPFLKEGTGTTLISGDLHYVVTEYGIAYLHGKNVRERAMELISIAHPKFRPWLVKEAKKRNMIYRDQAFIPGKKGEYPEDLEELRTTKKDFEVLFRPVRISDESLVKEFFYSLSDDSLYKRFISHRKDMPHERLQDFIAIDFSRELVILATVKEGNKEIVIGLGQWGIIQATHTAEVAFVVRDQYQNKGVGTELLNYLIRLGKKRGLLGLTAEVLIDNQSMLHLFKKVGFTVNRQDFADRSPCCELNMTLRGEYDE